MVAAGAFVGGLLAVLLALGLSALASGRGHASIALAGVAVHALAQTVLMVLKLTADPEKELASIEYWIMGSLNAVTLSKILIPLLLCGVGLAVLFLLYRQILLLSVEEEEARLLGVSVGRMRLLILFCATLAVTAVVSVTGLISFIGLLAPHTARLLCRESGLPALWLSGLLGGVLLSGADMLARSIASAELPVSIFTSLLGAPFLIYLMMRKEG
jgi:iron complex transport system permease protein